MSMFKLFTGDDDDEKKESPAKTPRPEKPLRVTEVVPLNSRFRTIFCVNKYLNWKTSPVGKSTVKWSYKLLMEDGQYFSRKDVNLYVLSFGRVNKEYDKTNPESVRCHSLNFYYELSEIPFLEHQRGYNTHDKRHKNEVAERQRFYQALSSLVITFHNPQTGKELITFRAK